MMRDIRDRRKAATSTGKPHADDMAELPAPGKTILSILAEGGIPSAGNTLRQ